MERLDLHGFKVDDALEKVNSQIDWLVKKQVDILVINHGKGYHSEHGIGVIKQRVRALLKDKGPMLKEHGYMVVYGESDYPVALEYDEGCTLIVMRGRESEYLGGNKKEARNKAVYSSEGREMRKQQKRNRHQ